MKAFLISLRLFSYIIFCNVSHSENIKQIEIMEVYNEKVS
jgi:hypothetical protein